MIFLEREEGVVGGREKINVREKHGLVASCTCPDWGANPNLGVYPDRELNPPPFGVQDDAPNN